MALTDITYWVEMITVDGSFTVLSSTESLFEDSTGVTRVSCGGDGGDGNGNCSDPVDMVWPTSSPLSPTADVFLAAFLTVVDIVAVSLNLLVIVLSLKNRNSLTPLDYFVVLLAASDLGHPLLGYPMCIVAALQHGWNFGYIGCQVHGFLGFLFGVNSMTCLACMSFSRFLAVTQANFVRNNGKILTLVFILFSPLYALFWSLSPLLGWGRYDLEPYRTSCTLKWDLQDTSFVTASFIGCLAVPALLMCISYGHITMLALATGRRRRKWAQKPQDAAWSKQEFRLLKVTLAMCGTFVLAWSPYAILAMLTAYNRGLHIPVQVTPIAALAAKSSHVVNPILYCALNKKFQRFFPKLPRRSGSLAAEYINAEQPSVSVPLNDGDNTSTADRETEISQEANSYGLNDSMTEGLSVFSEV